MQPITAYIVDDEKQGRNVLRQMLLHHCPDIDIVGEAAGVENAIREIRTHTPSVVFLDIRINGETGFDLLNRLPAINFNTIFTTAFDQYALKAFRFNALDYLLKPIVAEELVEAVNKVKQRSHTTSKVQVDQLYQDIKNPKKTHDKLAIPTTEGFVIITVQDIVYCRANNNYTEFHLTNKTQILSSYTLKQYDELLSKQSFFRAHRSYLINLAHVKKYRRGDGGEIIMCNDHEIELSRTHKDEFLHLINLGQ